MEKLSGELQAERNLPVMERGEGRYALPTSSLLSPEAKEKKTSLRMRERILSWYRYVSGTTQEERGDFCSA